MYPAAATLAVGLDILGFLFLWLICSFEVWFVLHRDMVLCNRGWRVFFSLEDLDIV